MKLPNDILRKIFTYFDPSRDIPHYSRRLPMVFSIRAVCRWFRIIANEMQFWCNEDFNLVDLMPRFMALELSGKYQCRFLRPLLQDKDLIQCLMRRQVWRFRNRGALGIVIDLVPSLQTQPISIVLESGDWWTYELNDAITFLSVCQHLKSLELRDFEDERVNLNLIADSCSSLEMLRFLYVKDMCGTLKDLSMLKRLEICHSCAPLGLIPWSSASSLTHLSLTYASEFLGDSLFSVKLGDCFVNLTTFRISPLSRSVYDFILHAQINLIEFRTTVERKYHYFTSTDLVTMFHARSLHKLRDFRIIFDRVSEWQTYFPPVLECVTSTLSRLEHLVLGMGLDVSWNTFFTRLNDLEKLIWYVPQDQYLDLVAKLDVNLFDAAMIKQRFEDAFQVFYSTPSININIMLNGSYDSFCATAGLSSLFND